MDAADLKVQIKALKEERTVIEKEKRELQNSIAQSETRLATLKQELNLASATSDARGGAQDLPEDELGPEGAKRLRIMSDKLDMRILNDSIRAALPQLEKTASAWERQSKGLTKHSQRSQREQQNFPSALLLPTADVEEQVGDVMEARARERQAAQRAAEVRRVEKSGLCADIATLRRRLAVLQTEQGAAGGAQLRVRFALREEELRLQLLANEHRQVRDEVLGVCSYDPGSGGGGWPVTAFRELVGESVGAAGGGEDRRREQQRPEQLRVARVPLERVCAALAQWLTAPDPSPGAPDLLAPARLRRVLDEIWRQFPQFRPHQQEQQEPGSFDRNTSSGHKSGRYSGTGQGNEDMEVEEGGGGDGNDDRRTTGRRNSSSRRDPPVGLDDFCLLCERLVRELEPQQ